MSDNKTALVVIDAQVNMSDPAYPCYDARGVIGKLRTLIDKAHAADVPVIYIQNNGPEGEVDEPHTPGWEIDPEVAPAPGDTVIEKTTPDSFLGTGLDAQLRQAGVAKVAICGYATEFCVDTTTRRAAALGFEVMLVADGHTTHDKAHADAAQIVAHHNATLPEITSFDRKIRAVPAGQVRF